MKTCFIIMPVSTPPSFISRYNQDKDHFLHVLNHLIVPSVMKADLEPIPPHMKGAELIHAEIINYLVTADLVLCDVSTLNPNVFFELGVRTSLNKPISLIMDSTTEAIPFDTGILNHHKYNETLNAWTLSGEVESLAKHIAECKKKSKIENNLWKYFGMSISASAPEKNSTTDDKLDFLTRQVEALRAPMQRGDANIRQTNKAVGAFTELVSRLIGPAKILSMKPDASGVSIEFASSDLEIEELEALVAVASGLKIEIRYVMTNEIASKLLKRRESHKLDDKIIIKLE